MSLSIVITLEKDIPPASAAYAKADSGRALARESDRLDTAARRRSVAALTSMLSENPAALIVQMKAEGFDPAKMRLPPEQWFRAADGLKIIRSAPEVEELALSEPDNGGVYVVPAFAGLGTPHWDQYARGTIVGITRGTTSGHIARAALEGIAYQVADLVEGMHSDSKIALSELRVDGGAAANATLMQFQADILGVPVVRPAVTETTALGAAYLAGLATGYWGGTSETAGQWRVERRFEPAMPRDKATALRARWTDAVGRSKGWEKA